MEGNTSFGGGPGVSSSLMMSCTPACLKIGATESHQSLTLKGGTVPEKYQSNPHVLDTQASLEVLRERYGKTGLTAATRPLNSSALLGNIMHHFQVGFLVYKGSSHEVTQ